MGLTDMRRDSEGSVNAGNPPSDRQVIKQKLLEGGSNGNSVSFSDSEACIALNGSPEGRLMDGWEDEQSKWWKLYVLHFLFMWNMRTYEFATILSVSLAFPQSLAAASIRGITTTVFSMLCSSYVGSWIDSSPSRILPLLTTISTNHGATTAAYMCWAILAKVVGKQTVESTNSTPKVLLYIAILFLDAIQELSTIGNRLSLELDCVPALVDDSKIDSTYTLTQVNSVMRRIDMICKLIAPTVLPLIVGTLTNHAAWISLLAGITMISWGLEIWCAGLIAQDNARLCRPKEIDEVSQSLPVTSEQGADSFGRIRQAIFDGPIERLRYYFSMAIWPASLSLSIIQLTVLAYSATLMTFMLNIGFSLTSITIARASASILALASTFITPMIVKHMKKRQNQKNILDEESIVRRVGLWGIISQFLCLLPVVIIMWMLSIDLTTSSSHILLSVILFSFLSLSRIGHWMFDLMVQELEQVEIPTSQRSTFSSVEQSLRSFFELTHWGATFIWSDSDDFKWLALGSWIVLGAGVTMYGLWCNAGSSGTRSLADERYEEVAMRDNERET